MDKSKPDYDLFRRICRKQCIPPAEEEVEVFEAESEEVTIEEEEEIEEEEPFDLNAWSKELECMKRRIQMLQLRLKQKLDECPEEECVDLEVELNCSENKEICTLQKDHYKLQYQITELVRCCRFAKDQIKDLRTRMCEKSKDIQQLQKTVAFLESWRKTLSNEFGKCVERFEYLKHVKAEWKDVLQKIEKQKEMLTKFHMHYVPKLCYAQDKIQFRAEADCLKDLFKSLCLLQSEKFLAVEERLSKIEARLPPLPEAIKNKKMQTEKTKECSEEVKLKPEPGDSVNKIYYGQKELRGFLGSSCS